MNSLELILLVLFIVIVYLTIIQKIPSELIVGVVALWFTVLWIGADNMGAWNSTSFTDHIYKKKYAPNCTSHAPINTPTDSPKSNNEQKDPKKEVAPPKQLLPDSERPKPLEYSENNYLKNIFDEIGSLGDNKLAHRMKYLSNMNRVAIDNRARLDKYTNLNYLTEELDDHANSVWWDDDVALEKQF